MNKDKIVNTVKRQEEDKVAVSLKLPANLKEQIQELAEKESISMNSLIIATLYSLVDDDCGKQLNEAKSLLTACGNIVHDQMEIAKDHMDDPDSIKRYYNLESLYERVVKFKGGLS